MEKDAFYFPHFCNARQDRKIKRVRKELGLEGYGIYFMLLETLREQQEFKFPMEDIDLLADEFGTSEQKIRTVICNYDLFQIDEQENFFSISFIKYLTPYLEGKQRKRIAGIKGNLIKYGYATKESLESLSDLDIIELNENKALIPKLSHSESHSESLPSHTASQSKEKESKINKKESKENIYTEIFNYYLSKENLVKHKELIEPMIKSINLSIKTYGLDIDYIKKIIDRHSEKIENTKNSQYPVSKRTIQELFGQKKYKSQDLICADYLDEVYITEVKEKKSFTKQIGDYKIQSL